MFREVSKEKMVNNVFSLIGEGWMLITAGGKENFNTMTASWGGFGVLWQKKVSFIFVRPQRYTYEFLEKNNFYTLSFFDEEKRDDLTFCGTHSGRDVDKIQNTSLTPYFGDDFVCFNEARLVVVCKKIYSQDISKDRFIEKSLLKEYPQNDFHRMYVGEVLKVLI